MPDLDPSSYAYQEGIGQVPSLLRLAQFRIYGGTGAPSNSVGADGDFFLRSDGAGGANTCIYHKEAGAWVGLTA
jgi:hypothetical protein